jgi:hypothetical protein
MLAENEMGGARSTHWKKRNVCKMLVGNPERKGLIGRTMHRWEDSIQKDIM